jgi:poly(A) polymerase
MSIDTVLCTLSQLASELGVEAYVVGGYVRDRLLGREGSKDIDVVVVGGSGATLLSLLAERLGWSPPAVFERFGTAHATGDGIIVEAVRARSERYDPESRKPDVRPGTLAEDVWRRDFTINTLCVPIAADHEHPPWFTEVLDYTGRGLDDLESGILRTPLDPAETFAEDPLRMVRAARFVSKLDVHPAVGLVAAMRAAAARLRVVSVERVAEELRQILVAPQPSRGLELLRDGGVLDVILPELVPTVGCAQDPRHHLYDVWEHTVRALDAAPAELTVRLAVLLHDVGKPATRAVVDGRVTFHGHAAAGAELAAGALRRLRFSDAEVTDTRRLVDIHMRPVLYRPESDGAPMLRRLVRDAGELRGPMLAVARADVSASAHPDAAFLDDLERRLAEVDRTGAIAARRCALDGEVIMRWGGRGPGPWVGAVQRAYTEAVLDGRVPPDDPEAAAAWLAAHGSDVLAAG